MFMFQQFSQQGMGATHPGLSSLFVDAYAQGQGVDEQPHNSVGAFPTLHATEQDTSEDDILTSGELAEHLGPGEMTETGGAYPQPAGVSPDAAGQSRVQAESGLLDAARLALPAQ